MSGKVRPLSGRVFMRRTTERGWVAKAYPDPPSLTELDIFDDLSTTSSLDSFFDDDFDTCQQDEKLQNLLTCNTLGVESKVRVCIGMLKILCWSEPVGITLLQGFSNHKLNPLGSCVL